MTAYDSYINGDLRNFSVTDQEIRENLKEVDEINKK
jgi:tryptophan synthase beta chain